MKRNEDGTKYCPRCRTTKNADTEFALDSTTADGLNDWCRQCKNKYWKSYYEKNKKKIIERVYKWQEKHPERVLSIHQTRRERIRSSGGSISQADWQAACEFYGMQCLCCGSNTAPLHMDHVIPISSGGANVLENVQPLCETCNKKKASKETDYRKGVVYIGTETKVTLTGNYCSEEDDSEFGNPFGDN